MVRWTQYLFSVCHDRFNTYRTDPCSHSMIDGTLELPNILSIAQSLRGDDIYGNLGLYPKSMSDLTKEKEKT